MKNECISEPQHLRLILGRKEGYQLSFVEIFSCIMASLAVLFKSLWRKL